MKKLFFLALVLALLVPMSAMAQATPLKFLYYIDASQAGYAEDQAIWQKFKDDNPDIDLQMEILFNEPYHQKLGAYIAAGNIPDVIYMWPSNKSSSAILQQMHLTKDLTPLLGKDFLSNFVAPALNPKAQASRLSRGASAEHHLHDGHVCQQEAPGGQRLRASQDLCRPQGHGSQAEGKGNPGHHASRRRRLADAVLPVLHGRRPHARRRLGRPGEDGQDASSPTPASSPP